MTLPKELVKAVADVLGAPKGSQWRGAYGSVPPHPDAWHYEFSESCSIDLTKAAQMAVAAVLRALPECDMVKEWATDLYMAGWHAVAPLYETEPIDALQNLARLADQS